MTTANSNTAQAEQVLRKALQNIPDQFRTKIVDSYVQVREAYDESNFDTTSLRVGKFCEAVIRFLQHDLTGTHIAFGTRITNFSQECDKIQQLPKSSGSESLRLIIPKALEFAFTVRNKRGVGHVGGDVDANQIDAATVMRVADWVLCELLRHYHKLSLEEAQELLDTISVRHLPMIWSVGDKKRVLNSTLSLKDQMLVLLHSDVSTAVTVEDMMSWLDYAQRVSDFKRWVLKPSHKLRLIEYDEVEQMILISPTGSAYAEGIVRGKLTTQD